MGGPKALLVDDDGTPRLLRVADDLLAAGCDAVTVVLGAEAARTVALMAGHAARVVVAEDWSRGMGSSLRRGLLSLQQTDAVAALVMLVDLPDVAAPAMRRVLEHWRTAGARPDGLVRATYGGRPGHPVLLGRDHWAALAEELTGDEGARSYLDRRKVLEVSCDDLATGRDVDRPEDLGPGGTP
jgi:CTP:molybdopterin cytidylyltransferase MocA